MNKNKRNNKIVFMLISVLVVAVLLASAVLLARIINGNIDINIGNSQSFSQQSSIVPNNIKTISGPPYVIALDAGHGGIDLGATGLLDEVEMTERTVEYLFELLAANPMFTPVLCRAYGEGVDVSDRAAAAQNAGAALLFSVHGNADVSSQSNGFECYPVTPGRTWHEESLGLAQLVTAEIGAEGHRLRGEGGIRYIYYGDDGEKTVREVSDNRVYEETSFAVLEKPNCIALLVEQGFITNENDVNALATDEGCKKAAECYYRAICMFFEGLPIEEYR